MRLISLTIVTAENNPLNVYKFVKTLFNRYFIKELFKSAFFVLMFFGFSSVYASNSCQLTTKSNVEKAIVKWVYDGDTVLVTDLNGKNKRKIRIIGIDTPEVKHHQQKAQLYGAKAREHLRALLKGDSSNSISSNSYQIFLEFDKEKYDRYKRLLAHVYLANGINISEWLLQQGFAKTLIIPPNVKHVTCYKNAERKAQQQKLRLWKLKDNRVKVVQDLRARSKGYVRLKGKISRIKKHKKSVVLELESNIKRPIQLKIRKKNLRYFKAIEPDKLVAKEVVVSGVLKNKKGKRTITLNHSSQLELVSAIKTNNEPVAPTIKWSK